MENNLLAASMRSRDSYNLISQYIELKLNTYSKPFQVLMNKVGDYYKRDGQVMHVDPAILMAQVAETIRNEKHIGMFHAKVGEAVGCDVSLKNIDAIILAAKQQEVGDKLAQALAADASQGKVDDLLAQLSELRTKTSLAEVEEEEIKVLEVASLSALINKEMDPTHLIKLYPSALNDRLDGGAKRGHHIIILARPNAGKTAFCVNLTCGFISQGFRVLYIINEDREEDIYLRHVYNLSNMSKWDVMNDPDLAEGKSKTRGIDNLKIVGLAPGTLPQIESLIDEYAPDIVIVDQLRNLHVRAENRTNQLDHAARSVRSLGKKKGVLMISVTQAGDSAEGKAVLDMGDVDNSNTGIPAACDVLLAIGKDATLEMENRRMISLCKNKLGREEHFPVNIIPSLSRYTNV